MTLQASELIDELGGPTAVSSSFGVSVGAVRMWKLRNEIPAAYQIQAWRAAIDRGLAWEPPGAGDLRDALLQRQDSERAA